MKTSRFTNSQIIAVLKQAEADSAGSSSARRCSPARRSNRTMVLGAMGNCWAIWR